MNNKNNICFLEDFPSLAEGIFSLKDISKSQLKKLMKIKQLNIPIKQQFSYFIPLDVLNYGQINAVYEGPKVDIIFEDENFLLLAKPPGVHCHPLGFNEQNNLLSFLAEYSSKLLMVNKSRYDRGLIYRLDFDTSGIIYYAKSDKVQRELRENFHDIIQEKNYLAVVQGKTKKNEVLRNYLESYGVNQSLVRITTSAIDSAAAVECSYETLDYNQEQDLSLIQVKLKTGHRHQIRVQLQAIGHAILGDPIYSEKKYHRMMLHCHQYHFNYHDKGYSMACEFEELRSFFTNFNSKS